MCLHQYRTWHFFNHFPPRSLSSRTKARTDERALAQKSTGPPLCPSQKSFWFVWSTSSSASIRAKEERRTKERKFHLLLSDLSLLLFSRSLHHLLHIGLHLSAKRLALTRFQLWKRKDPHSSWHTPACLSFFFILKRSWLEGRRHVSLYISCCLALSVSAEPPRPDRLDYISALVRPGDVFTKIINFILCPSIQSYVQLKLHP